MDIVALDHCLDETNDDLAMALPLFSQRQTPEGLALWKLLQLPGTVHHPHPIPLDPTLIIPSLTPPSSSPLPSPSPRSHHPPHFLSIISSFHLSGKLQGPLKAGYQLSQIVKGGVFTLVSALLRALLLPLAKLSPNMMRGVLNRIENVVRKATMPTQNALSLTTIPFSDIVKVNSFWVTQAMKSAGASDIEYEP